MNILDLHVDSIIQQRLFGYRVTREHRSGMRGQPLFWHADVPRMCEAGYRGACLGIHYYPWESDGGWREMHRQIDYLDEVITLDSRVLRVREPADWLRAKRDGQLALAPGVEGAHMLNRRVDRVEELARRGIAYLTLTHFSKNFAASPSMGWGANESEGLTESGKELVAALEEYEILVDVAHVNTPGVLDVCAAATRPVLCSHTGLKGVSDHARNITDEEIDAIVETGGVIGIMFAPIFLAGKLRADSTCVLDHIEYLLERAGSDHVAIGSDYDGWLPTIPSDQRDCRDISVVIDGLRERGRTEEEVSMICGENAVRLLAATPAVA